MDSLQVSVQNTEQLGRTWIQAIIDKDFNRLADICQPEVRSRLMTPNRVDVCESAAAMAQKVEGWFKNCESIHVIASKIDRVVKELAISYRLELNEDGTPYLVEQQLYGMLRAGRIETLSLLCSGFQPVQVPDEAPTSPESGAQSPIRSDALLEFNTGGGRESTCAILTPTIKRKLGEMSSGQVLEVRVDDPTVNEDIESWCRLSGNMLLKMERDNGQGLRFYVMKK